MSINGIGSKITNFISKSSLASFVSTHGAKLQKAAIITGVVFTIIAGFSLIGVGIAMASPITIGTGVITLLVTTLVAAVALAAVKNLKTKEARNKLKESIKTAFSNHKFYFFSPKNNRGNKTSSNNTPQKPIIIDSTNPEQKTTQSPSNNKTQRPTMPPPPPLISDLYAKVNKQTKKPTSTSPKPSLSASSLKRALPPIPQSSPIRKQAPSVRPKPSFSSKNKKT